MDASEFRRSSHAVWDAMAQGWEARHTYFEETARPVTEAMLDRLAVRPGEKVLDLAAGTGVVGLAAATAVGAEGLVVVSDFAESMVDAARRQAAALGLDNVECRVLDAEHLDLPDATFDAAVCRWGYMLMADPGLALSETRRVLRPGGRMACAVFAGSADNPWASLPMAVLVELGAVPPPEPGAPGILALADLDRLRAFLDAAGFADVRIDEVPFRWSFTDADDYWAFLTDAAGAIAVILGKLDDAVRRQVRDEITARVAAFEAPGHGLAVPSLAIVASAVASAS